MTALATLDLINEIQKICFEYKTEQYFNVLELCDAIKIIKEKEEKNLPYHINIIDLLWADENAHSRILAHLLGQNNDGKFEILESFIHFLLTRNEHFDLKISNPKITSEKHRIDILVEDEDFALIIENKIHYATDQNQQLKRYIETLKNRYSEEQIYILYLPRDEYKKVEDQSWGEYKERFQERFINFTYRDEVLPWLKDEVLPNIKIKEIHLKSALEQYIDHLEGLFSIRKNQQKMNKELQKKIAEKLGLGKGLTHDLHTLEEKLREIDEVRNQLNSIKEENEKYFWDNVEFQIKRDFPNLELYTSTNEKYYPKVGISLSFNDKKIFLLIEKETTKGQIYFGILKNDKTDRDEEIIENIFHFSPNGKATQYWYSYTYTTYEKAYEELKTLIIKVQNYLLNK